MTWAKKKFQGWPADASDLEPAAVVKMYEDGFIGAKDDPEQMERLKASLDFPKGEDVAHRFGLADSAKGQLVVPFVHTLELFPGSLPGPAQGRGDCVSHGAKNSALCTMVMDVVGGWPDHKSGFPEEIPQVPQEGVANGVLSSEAIYWWRGYNGDGWHCPSAVAVMKGKSCIWVRKPYDSLGFDLSRYSAQLAGKWGAKAPPEEVLVDGRSRLCHDATVVNSPEVLRDLLANGHGVICCGGEGYGNRRNEHGVSRRSGSWAHSMSEWGFDDRPWAHQTYGGPLVLTLNSWAKWNSGPRDIHDSASLVPPHKKQLWIDRGIVNPSTGNIMIPEGSWWSPWSDVARREKIALAGVAGFAKKKFDWVTW